MVVTEGTVACLPCEFAMEIIPVDPNGALAFQLFNEVSDALSWVHADKDVNMVGDTSDI